MTKPKQNHKSCFYEALLQNYKRESCNNIWIQVFPHKKNCSLAFFKALLCRQRKEKFDVLCLCAYGVGSWWTYSMASAYSGLKPRAFQQAWVGFEVQALGDLWGQMGPRHQVAVGGPNGSSVTGYSILDGKIYFLKCVWPCYFTGQNVFWNKIAKMSHLKTYKSSAKFNLLYECGLVEGT